jgi:hypothetical protein
LHNSWHLIIERFWHQQRRNLKIARRLFHAHYLNNVRAMFLEVFGERLKECVAEFVSRPWFSATRLLAAGFKWFTECHVFS